MAPGNQISNGKGTLLREAAPTSVLNTAKSKKKETEKKKKKKKETNQRKNVAKTKKTRAPFFINTPTS